MQIQIQFKASGDLAANIQERAKKGSSNLAAKRDIERYYHLLSLALSRLSLTEGEASLICEVCNGWLMESPISAIYLWAGIADALDQGLGEKWGVDPDLAGRVRLWDPLTAVAVVDAAERFWNGLDKNETVREGLIRVQLLQKEQERKDERERV